MSAFRQAVLSINPERLEQFSREVKKNIKDKPKKRKRPNNENSKKRDSKSARSSEKKKKRRKSAQISKNEKDQNDGKQQEVDKERSSLRHSSKKSSRDLQRSSSRDRKRRLGMKVEEDSDMEKDGLDLAVTLVPLTDLVKDRTALLDTVFNIIKGPKLTSMLPDILKLMPIEKIKYLCCEQLDVMSSKRLHHILAGIEMEFSSGTDSSDDEDKQLKETIRASPSPVQDSGLQANFVDSTTSESVNPSKLMLFPSAISTALTLPTGSFIPVKEISNDNDEVDLVSTSTEPNFIYSGDGNENVDESYDTSDPEEGEVTSSEGASASSSEENLDGQRDDFEEEVFVEEEELEEDDEVRSPRNKYVAQRKRSGCTSVQSGTAEESTNTSEQMIKTIHESSEKNIDLQKKESDPYAGKSQLEILELEMRARAIRSLMKAAQSGKLNPTK